MHKSKIRKLIAEGRLEEALKWLNTDENEVVMFLARFNQAKQQYNRGATPRPEYDSILNNLRFSVLDYIDSLPEDAVFNVIPEVQPEVVETDAVPGVFISYSQKDSAQVERIKNALIGAGIGASMDVDLLGAGDSIVEFIRNSLKNNKIVLSVVSQNSLRSGWVGKESIAAVYSDWLENNRFIPVSLDNSYLDSFAYVNSLKNISEQITGLDEQISLAKSYGGDPRPIEDERNRLNDLRTNFGKILQRIREVNVIDLSDANFERGIVKVINAIKKQ